MLTTGRTFRIVTISLGVIVAVLLCAIGVVAASRNRVSPQTLNAPPVVASPAADIEAARIAAEREKKAAADRKEAESRDATLENENGELKDQVKTSANALAEQSKKLSLAMEEVARLRKDIEAARADTAELQKNYERVEAELSEAAAKRDALAKQIEDTAAAVEKPAIAKAQPNKAKVARAKGNRSHSSRNYYRGSSPDMYGRAHDPGVGPRLAQKSDDSPGLSDQ